MGKGVWLLGEVTTRQHWRPAREGRLYAILAGNRRWLGVLCGMTTVPWWAYPTLPYGHVNILGALLTTVEFFFGFPCFWQSDPSQIVSHRFGACFTG